MGSERMNKERHNTNSRQQASISFYSSLPLSSPNDWVPDFVWVKWHTPIIPGGGKLKQEDYYEFKVSLITQ